MAAIKSSGCETDRVGDLEHFARAVAAAYIARKSLGALRSMPGRRRRPSMMRRQPMFVPARRFVDRVVIEAEYRARRRRMLQVDGQRREVGFHPRCTTSCTGASAEETSIGAKRFVKRARIASPMSFSLDSSARAKRLREPITLPTSSAPPALRNQPPSGCRRDARRHRPNRSGRRGLRTRRGRRGSTNARRLKRCASVAGPAPASVVIAPRTLRGAGSLQPSRGRSSATARCGSRCLRDLVAADAVAAELQQLGFFCRSAGAQYDGGPHFFSPAFTRDAEHRNFRHRRGPPARSRPRLDTRSLLR